MKSIPVVLFVLVVTVCAGSSYAQWSLVNGMSAEDFLSLVVRSKDTIFVGTNADGVYRTYDNGTSWSLVLGYGLYDVYKVSSLAFDPSGNVYAGSYSLGLLRSTNNGDSWTFMSANGLPQSDVYAVAANSSGTVFASDFGSIYRSTDGGSTWAEVRHSISGSGGVCSIACRGSDTVYACGTTDWFYYSTNNGLNWTWVGSSSGLTQSPCAVAVHLSGYVFVGTKGGGVFRSTNRGANWSAVNNGLTSLTLNTLSISNSGVIYAGTSGGGVFFSTDVGLNWAPANDGLTHKDIRAFALDSLGHVYAGAYAGGRTGGLWQATAPLPIQLTSFTAAEHEGVVTLQWKTATEVNNYGFEIQRSVDQGQGYETIPGSFVKGNGTTIQEHSYHTMIDSRPPGAWYYRLKQIDLDGTVAYSEGILPAGLHTQTPPEYSLDQGYPNPFNPSTTIRYALPGRSPVTLTIYNTLGQRLTTLVEGEQEAGYHEVKFDAAGLSSGVYFCRLQAGSFVETKNLLLVR